MFWQLSRVFNFLFVLAKPLGTFGSMDLVSPFTKEETEVLQRINLKAVGGPGIRL